MTLLLYISKLILIFQPSQSMHLGIDDTIKSIRHSSELIFIIYISNFDCFHPSLKGHQWISKILWNQLFSNQQLKPKVFSFDENETIYCPVDSDRIAIN